MLESGVHLGFSYLWLLPVRTLITFYFDIIQNVSERILCLNFYGLILAMDRASGQSVPFLKDPWLHIIGSTVNTLHNRMLVTYSQHRQYQP